MQFEIDYNGGTSIFGHEVWQTFRNVCKPYIGPSLYAVVAACTAPDGSNWALQSWQEPLPDLGFTPWLPAQKDYWLELSHWSGPLAQLSVYQGWVYDQTYRALFGKYTYKGEPIHGFGTTRTGRPTDSYGRLLYLDTFDSVYGSGWHRENSFVSHNPSGAFCYGFFPFDPTKGGYEYPWTAPSAPSTPTWSGFVLTNPTLSPIFTRIDLPNVTCNTVGKASMWVGFDGYNDDTVQTNSTVEQDGVTATCDRAGGSPSFSLWYELYRDINHPDRIGPLHLGNPFEIAVPSSVPLVAGDSVDLSVAIIQPSRVAGIPLGRDKVVFTIDVFDSSRAEKKSFRGAHKLPRGPEPLKLRRDVQVS